MRRKKNVESVRENSSCFSRKRFCWRNDPYFVLTFAYQVSYAKAVEIVQNYLEQAAFEGEVFLIFPELTNCHVECHLDEKGKHFRFEDSFICNCLIKHECYRN
jgi:hypothetical protein